MSSLYSF